MPGSNRRQAGPLAQILSFRIIPERKMPSSALPQCLDKATEFVLIIVMHRLTSILGSKRKIVLKIGTTLLADKVRGINASRIEELSSSVSALLDVGYSIVIVSSGAIGAGVGALGLKERPRSIPGKQAAAAIGQPILMESYERAFRLRRRIIAQILLTRDDLVTRARYINIRNTFSALFDQGVVPIVNENDSVAVDEIKLGDNDNLAAFVANLIEAGLLIILSDVDGLFTEDPAKNPSARIIPIVERITPQVEKLAGGGRNELGTGGMVTKIAAAKRCTSSGIPVIITNGTHPNVIEEIVAGRPAGTLFLPRTDRLSVRKKWIGFVSDSHGAVVVDEGARGAVLKGQKSLLPSGIMEVRGQFAVHDTISVLDGSGKEIAKGVTDFSSAELQRIKGRRTEEIPRILSRKGSEVINRNNLVLTGTE